MIRWNNEGIMYDMWYIQECIRYSSMRYELKDPKNYPWYQRGIIKCDCSATLCPCIKKMELSNPTDVEIWWLKGEPLVE